MCYRALEQQNGDHREETRPTHFPQLRPRWIGAAIAIVAAIAFAVLLALPAVRDASAGERASGPPQVAAAMPQQVAIEKASNTALPADDGVPTPADVSRAAGHDCHHGM